MEMLNRLMKSCTSAHRHTYVPPRTQRARQSLLCARATTFDTVFPLEAGCSVSKAAIGFNSAGYRGLLATENISRGDVVLSIPLHNMLQVPRQLRQPHIATAAAAALATWQQHHGQLPEALLAFFLNPDVIWEAKLVAWLLHLRAAAPAGSLWDSYCQSLPTAAEAITFCSYSQEHAEQLQFSTWKVWLQALFAGALGAKPAYMSITAHISLELILDLLAKCILPGWLVVNVTLIDLHKGTISAYKAPSHRSAVLAQVGSQICWLPSCTQTPEAYTHCDSLCDVVAWLCGLCAAGFG